MRSLFGVVAVLLSLVDRELSSASILRAPGGKKQLTIDDIFREPAGNASAPQFVEWSPDGRRLSFVRTNSTDGRDELYSLDPATGQGTRADWRRPAGRPDGAECQAERARA